MWITWRDVVSGLALAATAVTLWLRVSDRREKNRQARRHRELIEADPVDPLNQVTPEPTSDDPADGDDAGEGDEHDGGQDNDGTGRD